MYQLCFNMTSFNMTSLFHRNELIKHRFRANPRCSATPPPPHISRSKECSTSFQFFGKVQYLPTKGATAVQHFLINGSPFLTFGINHGDIHKHKTSSVVYKMDEPSEKFAFYQTLQTRGAYGLEYISISDKHFLAVAYHWDGTYQLDSVVFQ